VDSFIVYPSLSFFLYIKRTRFPESFAVTVFAGIPVEHAPVDGIVGVGRYLSQGFKLSALTYIVLPVANAETTYTTICNIVPSLKFISTTTHFLIKLKKHPNFKAASIALFFLSTVIATVFS